jgi:biotin operon repressor
MKTGWEVKWELLQSNNGLFEKKEYRRRYQTFNSAKKAVRKVTTLINLTAYTNKMREGVNTLYRNTIADFINQFLHGEAFFKSLDELPSDFSSDYPIVKEQKIQTDDSENEIEEDDWDDEQEDEHTDFLFEISGGDLTFEYHAGAHPRIKTDMLVVNDETYDYKFTFTCQNSKVKDNNKIKFLHIELYPIKIENKAKYPIMILNVLQGNRGTPLKQNDIISEIKSRLDDDFEMERKAIWRNITLLKECGYDIQHNNKGYYIPKEESHLAEQDVQTIIGSIQASSEIEDLYKTELIKKLSKK